MESESRYTFVGATLLGLVLAAALTMVWLAGSGSRADLHYYTIHFEHTSLEGLQLGSDVNVRGIKVGRVEEYSISRDNINRVNIIIRVDLKSPLSDNTVATMDRNILTGLAAINLVTSGTPGPELTKIGRGEKYPAIPEGESRDLTAEVYRFAATGASALDNVNQLLNQENREAFAATLANLRQLSGALSQRVGKLDTVADALVRNSNEFAKSSREIAAAVDRVSASAQPVASQAEITLRDISHAAQSLERETSALATKVDGAADSSALEISATAQELRATAQMLARAADQLKDPRALVLGPSPAQLGPGEKLP
jgi:phospholipid/cholesterol/gamma-HCH transport system substrate-binding protein